MFKDNMFETLLSASIIVFAAGFLIFMRLETGIGSLSAYQITAALKQADGLSTGTDVKIAGLKVGAVTGLALEPKTYRVTAKINIRSDIKIPVDSSLSVSGGSMNSPYLSIKPGKSASIIPPGGTLGGHN